MTKKKKRDMIPTIKLDSASAGDGQPLELFQHDTEFLIKQGLVTVMSSRAHASEETLAKLGCAPIARRQSPCVLVGGLGLGFTLRAALDALPSTATVVVAELLEPVIRWNREYFGHLAGKPLDDERVEVLAMDVERVIATSKSRFDAVLLDVDNGPEAFIVPSNEALYSAEGLGKCKRALSPGGVLVVWSAHEAPQFTRRMKAAGFATKATRHRPRVNVGRRMHWIWLGVSRDDSP